MIKDFHFTFCNDKFREVDFLELTFIYRPYFLQPTMSTPLILALKKIEDENVLINVIETILKFGANVDDRDNNGYTPLTLAVIRERKKIVKTLLAAGADVNARSCHGQTPIMYVSQNGSAEMLRTLLDAGADPNMEDVSGWNSLMCADRCGNMKVVPHLLFAGATMGNRYGEWISLMITALTRGLDFMICHFSG